MRDIRPHGSWPSPLSAARLADAKGGLSWPQLAGGARFWIEARPEEAGRSALMRMDPAGEVREWSKAPFNARTRLHEYGGRPYLALSADDVIAVDWRDQRIWRLRGGAAEPLTKESGSKLRYADFAHDPKRNRIYAIEEDHRGGGEPANRLIGLDLDAGGRFVIDDRSDFVAAPALSPSGDRLAWIAWDHPNMPWDETALRVAPLDADGRIGEITEIEAGGDRSRLQPMFFEDGALCYFTDRTGWWAPVLEGAGAPMLERECDLAGPLWAVGERWGAPIGDDLIVALPGDNGDRLARIDRVSGHARVFDGPYSRFSSPWVENSRALVVASSPIAPSRIVEVDLADGSCRTIAEPPPAALAPADVSKPEKVSFESAGGRIAHGYYYPPSSSRFGAPEGEKPPLIVKIHGGPTGAASPTFDPKKQFWTSRGFALIDVDYAGSTGYGRAYRDRLRGAWGIADVEDCIAAARAMAERGLADPARLIITGGSAGGFTALAALARGETFAAGCSIYGVADLEALARDTHKFESRYLDRLIGPYPERRDLYVERSPIRHVDALSSPLIVLQGLDDKVVPPNQSEAIVNALREKNAPVAYLAFEGEGHGFRKAENVARALEAELAFYRAVLAIEAEEVLAPLEIENL